MVTPNTPSTHYPGASQERRGNLIDFYNQVYSTNMQHFAEQFAPTSGVSGPFGVSALLEEVKERGHKKQIHGDVKCINIL